MKNKSSIDSESRTLANTVLVAATSSVSDASNSELKQIKKKSPQTKCQKTIKYSELDIENLIINDLYKRGFIPKSKMIVLFRTFRAFKFRIESAHLTKAIIKVVPLNSNQENSSG